MTNQTDKPKLDFLGIGFTKCGSTWVYKCLEEHPEISVSRTKETSFFVNQDLLARPRDLKYLEKFFEDDGGRIRGEFSPMYATKEIALKNIKEFYPEVKLLFILRDPVAKRVSEMIYNHRFDGDMGRVDFDGMIYEKFKDAREQSVYYKHLKKWFDNFPHQNIHIMFLEEVKKCPERETERLYDFLGVDTNFKPQVLQKKANPAHAFRFPGLQRVLRDSHRRIKKYPRLLVSLKKFSKPFNLKQRILNWNKKDFQKPKISGRTEKLLFELHKKEIDQLEKLLKKDLSFWKDRSYND